MADSSGHGGDHFPGFDTSFHKDEFVFRRSLSCRLQRRAPCPLLLPPKPLSSSSSSSSTAAMVAGVSPAFGSMCQNNKDPIPLLSPLVLPSMLQLNPTSH
ncbi:PREDICTED: uncharacterized protein LOC104822892 [Tarenaya hassleriana]|uniref:uncharacterized protein LOC104822892 n=1 Tax=Tarenaya hassleriana TaxID=28532 RepID=UPI00053C2F93|nr:PREDICTED: uncharacterized protein LOC104822892 [Tarenaya hassleriana]